MMAAGGARLRLCGFFPLTNEVLVMPKSADVSVPVDPQGRIVVGVDGSPTARLALRWALQEGLAHGRAVTAVCTYEIPAIALTAPVPTMDPGFESELAKACTETLEAELAEASSGLTPGAVELRVVEGSAARVLIDASHQAALLVLGSRGHGGFVGLLLGSVSQQCVAHAGCPVVVMRSRPGADELLTPELKATPKRARKSSRRGARKKAK